MKETIVTAYNSAVSYLWGAWEWLKSQVCQLRESLATVNLVEKMKETAPVVYERAIQQTSSFLQKSMNGTMYTIARWAGTCAGVVMAAAIVNEASFLLMVITTTTFIGLLVAMQYISQVGNTVNA